MFNKGDIVVWKADEENEAWKEWAGHRARVEYTHDGFVAITWLDNLEDHDNIGIDDGWYEWRFELETPVVSREELEQAYSVD